MLPIPNCRLPFHPIASGNTRTIKFCNARFPHSVLNSTTGFRDSPSHTGQITLYLLVSGKTVTIDVYRSFGACCLCLRRLSPRPKSWRLSQYIDSSKCYWSLDFRLRPPLLDIHRNLYFANSKRAVQRFPSDFCYRPRPRSFPLFSC
jgi:hypothetical protein